MVPRIFVSSTIRDLVHVRDAIRELIEELGYQPVMSEYGEIGYLPELSAADACYREVNDCDFGIVILGKRYGDDHRDGVSVTHNEYRTLVSQRIPIITIVEKDVLSYRTVFAANSSTNPVSFPGMDHPVKTFGLLSEISSSPQNNGISEFTHNGDARSYVRKQLAHVFGNLLRNTYEPIKAEVKDVLAEVRSLRNELMKGQQQAEAIRFLRVARALLEDSRRHFREFLERAFGNSDQPVSAILTSDSLDQLLSKEKWAVRVFPTAQELDEECNKPDQKPVLRYFSRWSERLNSTHPAEGPEFGAFAILSAKQAFISESALELFRSQFAHCLAAAG
jgi:hypothetical protein